VPVEFLSDDEAARYGRFSGAPSRAELERAFFLDDVDKALVARRRGDHTRLGFALQLTTVRFLGTFLPNPLDVPAEVVAYLAEQLGIADPSCVERYTERRTTRFEHVEEIKGAYGLRDFAEAEGFAHVHFHVIPRMPDQAEDIRGPRVFQLLGVPEAEIVQDADMDSLCRQLASVLTARRSAP
jgi:TnpA family transposase